MKWYLGNFLQSFGYFYWTHWLLSSPPLLVLGCRPRNPRNINSPIRPLTLPETSSLQNPIFFREKNDFLFFVECWTSSVGSVLAFSIFSIKKWGHFRPLFLLFPSFKQFTGKYKILRMPVNLNRGPAASRATTLPTEPQLFEKWDLLFIRWRYFYKNIPANPGLFPFIFVLFVILQFKFKKRRSFAWDSNPGPQDGWQRRIHWAMAATVHVFLHHHDQQRG